MQCPRCHAQNDEGARFCEDCGARLEGVCPRCGQPVTSGKRFCRSCGAAVTTEAPRFSSPESYIPKHLAEKILTSKNALEGERKQVTVLFADLKGSMELLAERDPEEARTLLDPVLERMMEAVHRYEGTVNQVMGDGIMALFGAPVAHEDHAVRACYAALDIQASIRHYAEEVRRTHGVEIQVRVGLNSGEVVVRAIGSDLRMDYSAIGQTTHLAARMEQLALPGSIRLTGDTLRLAEGYVETKPLGQVPVKGLEAPIEVYEMVAAGPLRSRLHVAAARGLTRFVGRDSELEQLRQALGRAASGHGQVVAIVAEPGVGKSRLVWEVTHWHRTHGWLILQASSVSYGKATPYLPVIDLLKTYFQIQEKDDPWDIREKVAGKLVTLDEALKPALPAFLALLEIPVEEPQWGALDPPQRRQRTLDAVKRLLLRESRVQPLLLVFEDLHWIDTETRALLDLLVENLHTSRLLLLVNYRPEYKHRWESRTYCTQLRLDPLPAESSQELLHALLGDNPSVSPLKPLLVDRTEGNPFFLEESIRTLVETKVLVGERGAYRLAKGIERIQVPATVQSVLAARTDRLPPEDKRLLQSASVIGKDVPFVLLQALAELPEGELRHGLARLQAAEFLDETRPFPNLEYTFKHALTHEVTYRGLLQDRRRALHARVLETIENLYSVRRTEHVERLAHHAVRGEVWDKAVTYLHQAGTKAAGRSAHREAVTHFEQALAGLAHLPETRETLKQAIDLRFDLRNSLYPLGELDRVLAYLQDAERLARTLDDRGRLGWVSAYLSHYFFITAPLAEARRFAQSAQAIAETLDDFRLRVVANLYLGTTYRIAGDCVPAEGVFRTLLELLEADQNRERFSLAGYPSVLSRAWLAWSLAERGETAEAIAYGHDALHLAEELDHPFSLVAACWTLAYPYDIRGELRQTIPLLERAFALSNQANLRYWAPFVRGLLGHAYARSQRVAEGLSLLEEAVGTVASMGARNFHSRMIANLGEACVLAERLQDAGRFALEALTLARQRGERGSEAWVLRLLGRIAGRRDPPEVGAAEDHYGQALAIAEQLGMRPLVAHCHLGLGKLHRRSGERAKSQEHLNAATMMYRAMDMGFWSAQAEAELEPPHGNSP